MASKEELGFKLETFIQQIKYLDSEDFEHLLDIAIDLNPIDGIPKIERLKAAEELRRRGYVKK